MKENGNKKEHGPHGPDCECSEDDEVVVAGMAIATCLSEIMKPLLDRWIAGDNGVTVDFRFDRDGDKNGIAVRARPFEDDPTSPMPDADIMLNMLDEPDGPVH